MPYIAELTTIEHLLHDGWWDPTDFALAALGCKEVLGYSGYREGTGMSDRLVEVCGTHVGRSWPCPVAEALARLVAYRDGLIRATITGETQP